MYSTTVELDDTKRSGWLGVGMMQPPPGAGIMYHVVCTAPTGSPLNPCEALRYIGVEAPLLVQSIPYSQHPLNNYNYNRYTNTRLNPI